jgi:hypothetical protein
MTAWEYGHRLRGGRPARLLHAPTLRVLVTASLVTRTLALIYKSDKTKRIPS